MSDYEETQPGGTSSELDPPAQDYFSVPPFKVGNWWVEPSLLRLVDDDEVVQLGPRIMHSLVVLAQRPGDVVIRRQFMERVWSDSIVTTDTLSMAISDLRRALGDQPQNPEYIETIRNVGYRLVAPVTHPNRDKDDTADRRTVESTRRPFPWFVSFRTLGIGLALIFALLLGKFATSWKSPPPGDTDQPILQSRPLTTYPSSEIHAALSPSGDEVAFAWAGAEQENLNIHVKILDSDPPRRLTDLAGPEYLPTWSPTGDYIAFVHARPTAPRGTDIMTVPASGGPIRRLIETDQHIVGLDWSPAGDNLVLSMQPESGRHAKLFILDIDSLSLQPIAVSAPGLVGAGFPAFSPDGMELAFVGSDDAGLEDVYVVPVAGGHAERLTFAQREVFGLVWTCDGRSIVFAAIPSQDYELWKVDRDNRTLTWLPTRGDKIMYPSINCTRRLLAYEETSCDFDVWRIDLSDPGAGSGGMVPIIHSTREDYQAQYSPDGQHIVFISTRGGSPQIWTCDREGKDQVRLTQLQGVLPEQPRWSPDGLHIGFNGIDQGINSVYVMNRTGDLPRRLSESNQHEVFSGWSRDNQWIYYVRVSGDKRGLWRMRPDGSRSQFFLEDARALVGQPSTEMGLVYLRYGQPGLWRRDSTGGSPELLVRGDLMVNWRGQAVVESGVYFTRVTGTQSTLNYLDFDTQEVTSLRQMEIRSCYGLSISPDRQSVIFNGYDFLLCDLVLVPEFQ